MRSPFRGDLVVLQTPSGKCSRVTPGHKLRVRWTEEALAGTAVYLMRRGRDWRIGVSQMATKRKGSRTFGPRLRQGMEQADDLWIIEVCPTRMDAEFRESEISLDYQIPKMLFQAKPEVAKQSQEGLDAFWASRDSATGALRLLRDKGMDPRYPLCVADRRFYAGGTYHGFLAHAANVMDGLMTVGTDSGGRVQAHETVAVDRDPFSGCVYSLDVPPHHYYVSGGVVVHNSMGWEDVDYALRVFLAGGMCVYQPTVRAYHHESIFRGRPSEKVQAWQQESYALLMEKYKDTNFAQFVPSL